MSDYAEFFDSLRPMVQEAVSFSEEWPELYREEILKTVLASALGGGGGDVTPQRLPTSAPPASPLLGSTRDANGSDPMAMLSQAVGVPTDDLRRVVNIDADTGSIRILGRIHGTSTRDSQTKCSVVYAYIKEKAFNELNVHVEALRQLCKDHGCYDSANFTSNFRKDSRLNEVKGSDPKRYIPTKSGLEEAEEILRAMAAS